jgi:DNA-binding NtrC family response regulator
LVVNDLAAGREMVEKELLLVGFSVLFAADSREALDLLGAERPDLIVTEHRKPRLDGIELVQRVRLVSDMPVVILTAFGSISDCERAMRAGADRFLQFRRDLARLGQLCRELVEKSEPRRVSGEGFTAEEARALAQRELRSRLQRLVVECRGNTAEIARRMKRDRSTVRYHLRRMDLLGKTSAEGRSITQNEVEGRD